ncbi:MAG: restriction endonuclease subunit S [Endomicrobium sp.]|jgi:type I restriction enzyme S subunit|nr:restriction endonuclease subunit S [Endomicrobium sp.]
MNKNNWQKVQLGDVANVKLSNVDKKTNPNEKTVKLCNYTDVYNNTFIDAELLEKFMIATVNDDELKKFSLKKGQVAITKDSETPDDIGVSAYIAQNFQDVVLGYHLSLITPIEKEVDGQFLNYYFHTTQLQKYFEHNASGSGQRCTLSIDCINQVPLILPQLPIQKSIAQILSILDNKIALNNKINSKLIALTQIIYDYWFVQFDFPDEKKRPLYSCFFTLLINGRQVGEQYA